MDACSLAELLHVLNDLGLDRDAVHTAMLFGLSLGVSWNKHLASTSYENKYHVMDTDDVRENTHTHRVEVK